MKTPTALLITVAFATAVTSAQQPAPGAPLRERLSQQDKDGDGKITASEATGLMKANFARIDANSDGVLDRAELAALAARVGQTMKQGETAAPRRQQSMNTEQLLARQTPDITIVPDIVYREGHERAWKLDLAMPKERGDTPRPGIVFIHGGGWRSGDKRTGSFLNGALEYAKKGYVCITINYRLTQEAPFPACIEDVKNAVRWFRANAEKYNLDPNRIGAYGNSAGAHLVSMLGLVKKDAGLEGDGPYQEQSSLVQAVCASATPTDFSLFPKARGGSGDSVAGNAELAKKSSPITYVAKDAPPFLLVHGTADTTVNVKHGDTFVAALKEAGAKDVTYLRIEGSGHGVFGQNADKTGPAMAEFFKRTLGGK